LRMKAHLDTINLTASRLHSWGTSKTTIAHILECKKSLLVTLFHSLSDNGLCRRLGL
jgi:antitoxin component HigA of HigAB toxin-antitoxin module